MDTLFVALAALCFGSFMNVLIYRIPRGLSIVSPGSACTSCKTPVAGYDNIPVLSYILLRGRCRACHKAISPVYPLTELAVGLLFTVLYLQNGPTLLFVQQAVFVFLLFASGMTDLTTLLDTEHFECGVIPDWYTVGGAVVGLLFSLFNGTGLLNAAIGAVAGYLLLYLPALAFRILRGVEGMGEGDFRLMAMIGAFTGWEALPFILTLSALTGVAIGIPVILITKNSRFPLPFGVMLAASGIVWALFGAALSDKLWNLLI